MLNLTTARTVYNDHRPQRDVLLFVMILCARRQFQHSVNKPHTLSQYKRPPFYFFRIFEPDISHLLQLLVHTYGKHTDNFCKFAYLKFYLAFVVTIGF